ncbi:MAG: sugar porter family MFS transporter [Candidatus Thermoplasmatota archaeon]|nr:sugar porter family MFS transporter [Candidatus Thermoplasmatota archaeon]
MFSSLDESRIRRVHLKITALSSGGNFLDGYDLAIISVAILLIAPEFSLSSLDQTLLLGSTLLGMVFGGVIGGYLTDRDGRKSIYMWDMVFFIVFTILTAVAATFTELLVFRLLLGLAIGADYAISPTIIAEYAPTKQRGKLLTVNGVAWFVGAAFSYLAGYFLSPLGDLGWRLMLLLGIIPALLVLILRASIPESPRWLLEKGMGEEARKSLKTVVGETGIEEIPAAARVTLRDLFRGKFLTATLFICSFWFILDAVTYAIALEGPTILQSVFNLSYGQASGTAALIAILAIIGAILTFFAIDIAGRRFVTMVGFLGMVITLFIASLFLNLSFGLIPVVILLVLFEISQEFGPGITSTVYPQELFPTSIRATAQGLGTTVSRIGALAGIFSFSFIVGTAGFGGGMLYLAVLSSIGLAVTIAYVVEPKGKSLEEISGEGS